MTGYPPIDAVYRGASSIQQVDCGTCPVTIACAIGKGGNGRVFKCCGSTGFETRTKDDVPLLLIIDCARHGFERFDSTDARHDGLFTCPLCDGGIMLDVTLGLTFPCEWIPTAHSRVSVETRLDVWRRSLPDALECASNITERKKTVAYGYTEP